MEMGIWSLNTQDLTLDSPPTGFTTLDKLFQVSKALGSAFQIGGE